MFQFFDSRNGNLDGIKINDTEKIISSMSSRRIRSGDDALSAKYNDANSTKNPDATQSENYCHQREDAQYAVGIQYDLFSIRSYIVCTLRYYVIPRHSISTSSGRQQCWISSRSGIPDAETFATLRTHWEHNPRKRQHVFAALQDMSATAPHFTISWLCRHWRLAISRWSSETRQFSFRLLLFSSVDINRKRNMKKFCYRSWHEWNHHG